MATATRKSRRRPKNLDCAQCDFKAKNPFELGKHYDAEPTHRRVPKQHWQAWSKTPATRKARGLPEDKGNGSPFPQKDLPDATRYRPRRSAQEFHPKNFCPNCGHDLREGE